MPTIEKQVWSLFASSAVLTLSACVADGDPSPEFDEVGARSADVEINEHVLAFDYLRRSDMPHGVAGDNRFVYLTEPLTGRVPVLGRISGHEWGELLPPEGDRFLLPFSVRSLGPGRVAVLDAGGFPAPDEPAVPRIYEYSIQVRRGVVHSQLDRSIVFDQVPFGFAEDFATTHDGGYVVTDSIFGAIWLVSPQGDISPGIFPASDAPADAIPDLAPCGLAEVSVDDIPFVTAGGFAPGVGAVTVHDGYVYFSGTCQGGIRRVPLDALNDDRPPHTRAADIELISARDGDAESLKGLAFDEHDPEDSRLYAADPFQLRVIRIDVDTGEREVIASDQTLFNFSVAIDFLPPLLGDEKVMVVAGDQEHRFSGINVGLTEDIFELPFRVAKVLVFD